MKRDTILIVDDMEVNRAILHALFEEEYNLLEAENGEQAVMLIKQYHQSLAAVLLDLVMPVKDGYQVMSELSQNGLLVGFPVIVITSEDSMENEVRAFDLGAADIIIKPFEPHVVRRRVRNAVELNRHKLHLEEMVEEQASKLRESRDVIMDALSSVIEHRSAETGQHVLRIRMFTRVLLENVMRCCPEYDLDERSIGVIAEAAALHDIGKIAIPDTILNKPGRLTQEEFEIMKTHTVKGCEILTGLDRMGDREYLQYAYNICRYHHERWDGRGYPDGLVGDNIPICAQAVGIADAYDALTTDRVYKKAIPPERALTMILNGECGAFSPKLLECLKNVSIPFEELVRDYADGRSPSGETARLGGPAARYPGLKGAADFGQMKYFALLRYLEATVLEADLDSGIYHLVYQQDEDFEDLRQGDTFEEAFRAFARRAVHPDDRDEVLSILSSGVENFFGSGLMKRSRKYRVLHRATGAYVWYEGTALRVDIDNPKQHRALFVWTRWEGGEAALPQSAPALRAPDTHDLPVSVQQCLNDRWFTMTYVNESFVSLFGYDKRELEQRFHNHYIEMVYQEDRQHMTRRLYEQLCSGRAQELEYRVVTKQGGLVWVLDRCQPVMGEDGYEYLNRVLTDITQIKQAQEELRLSMERYRIVQAQTNDIIFEWNLDQDQIIYSQNWEKKFGYRPVSSAARIGTASRLYPKDLPALQKLIGQIKAGMPYGEAELRVPDAAGQYRWCRLRATTQFDDKGRPVKAIGVVVDIDSEKRRTQELIHRAEQDALTKLYTKNAARDSIERTLENREADERFAMMIIDLDNFKQINDSRGHMFGDVVLAEAAACLKKLFRGSDTVARFGGDEFLVFLRHASDGRFLHEKAAHVVGAFRELLVEELKDTRLTCSIGIACCPEDGADFQTLFQRCDRALYQAKMNGKDRFAVYNDATMSKIFGLDAPQVYAAGTHIESDDADAHFSVDGIVPQAFRLLYESGDMETAVNAILDMAGRKYNVSRAYIFENSEDGTWCRNTFEWCGEGIEPQMPSLQHVVYAELGGCYKDNFNENNVFYCRDVAELSEGQRKLMEEQGIRSLLQCAIQDAGRFVGFVGFDDCALQRTWTQGQIDALTFISELLSTFLLKKRAQDKAIAAADDLQMMLDNQNAWIYVIDPDDYTMRYLNKKTLRTVPGAALGQCCHKAFFHRDTPCRVCPARDIRQTRSQTHEVYNPVLDVWTVADASLVRWDGADACLLVCHDVTAYKRRDGGAV
ncbi:MAG: diguanylate cyclase [Eubacteriales bacterium]|nr:diguanylate cyclase [Eubacteriales bacterium]